jgi:REP element-mobilizing transposase RayT
MSSRRRKVKNPTNIRIMSQSLANIVVHLIFSTKYRRPLLRGDERNRLHAYIAGILTSHKSPMIEINSVTDHIHILFAHWMSATHGIE